MEPKNFIIDDLTYLLLEVNGQDDRAKGLDLHEGWREVATLCGYAVYERTPMFEAYADGWYKPVRT